MAEDLETTVVSQGKRIDSLDSAFKAVAQAIQQLTELATVTDGRIDGVEEAAIHTDARLDALIDSQIKLTHHVEESERRFNQQIAEVNEAIRALTAAQAKTDEQIKQLLSRG